MGGAVPAAYTAIISEVRVTGGCVTMLRSTALWHTIIMATWNLYGWCLVWNCVIDGRRRWRVVDKWSRCCLLHIDTVAFHSTSHREVRMTEYLFTLTICRQWLLLLVRLHVVTETTLVQIVQNTYSTIMHFS